MANIRPGQWEDRRDFWVRSTPANWHSAESQTRELWPPISAFEPCGNNTGDRVPAAPQITTPQPSNNKPGEPRMR